MARSLQAVILFGLLACGNSEAQQWKMPGAAASQNVQPVAPVAPAAPVSPATPVTSATTSATKASTKQLEISAAKAWTDTGIDVAPGDKVTITSEGALTLLQGATITPDGMSRSWRDVMRSLPLNSAGTGALIARISDNPAVVPFLIGAKKEFTVTRSGRLFLGINLGSEDQLNGVFKTTVQVTPPVKTAANQVAEFKFNNALFDQIPRRITDRAGGIGDMVNFLMIGPVESVKEAFASAGWVQVDRTKQDAALHAVLATIQKQAYVEMPMSELYLFGRPQDFGFARAEPISVVQQRHHLRIWKAAFQFEGQDVWVGAATHDIGFEKDQRNNGVTHKIDPNVDEERDFVRASLVEGGGVISDTYFLPKDPVQEAKTATGGSFHSDGRVLILQLRAETPDTNSAGH